MVMLNLQNGEKMGKELQMPLAQLLLTFTEYANTSFSLFW